MKIELPEQQKFRNKKSKPAKVSFKFNRGKLLVQFSFSVHVEERKDNGEREKLCKDFVRSTFVSFPF